MLCGLFLSGLLLGTLSACGADQSAPVVMVQSSEDREGPEEDGTPAGEEVPEKTTGEDLASPRRICCTDLITD